MIRHQSVGGTDRAARTTASAHALRQHSCPGSLHLAAAGKPGQCAPATVAAVAAVLVSCTTGADAASLAAGAAKAVDSEPQYRDATRAIRANRAQEIHRGDPAVTAVTASAPV